MINTQIQGTQTEKNLLIAFAEECQSRNRYESFAAIARKEGFQQIADIFEKTARQEQSHAKQLLKHFAGGSIEINITTNFGIDATTLENLRGAVSSESQESLESYPEYASIALKEGFPAIAGLFKLLAKIEKAHRDRFDRHLQKLENELTFKRESPVRWECLKCGYIHEGEQPPLICPACQHPRGYFEEVLE